MYGISKPAHMMVALGSSLGYAKEDNTNASR
jgi:hypothetical protein